MHPSMMYKLNNYILKQTSKYDLAIYLAAPPWGKGRIVYLSSINKIGKRS